MPGGVAGVVETVTPRPYADPSASQNFPFADGFLLTRSELGGISPELHFGSCPNGHLRSCTPILPTG
jgi:hypothetical protein